MTIQAIEINPSFLQIEDKFLDQSLLDKTKKTAYLVFTSPFVWTFGSVVVSWAVLPAYLSVSLTASIVGGMILFTKYIPKGLFYESVLFDNIARNILTKAHIINSPYYNKMKEGIYLGALPLKNFHHDTLLQKLDIKAILSIVEDFEFNTETFFSSPVTKENWRAKGIDQLQLPVIDLTSISTSDLHKAADFINQHKEGVYIHCKAGRGRSVMSYMAYLIKYEGKSYDEAYVEVKANRPQMNLQSWQKTTLKAFAEGL